MKYFKVTMQHDNGQATLGTWATTAAQAQENVLNAEGAPASAVIKIESSSLADKLKADIEATAEAARQAGQDVKINRHYGFIEITDPAQDNGGLFFQGDDAHQLMEEHEANAGKFGVSLEDSILYSYQNW
jgi:hypothetical protein